MDKDIQKRTHRSIKRKKFQPRHKILIDYFRKSKIKNKRVLEIGTEDGLVLKYLSDKFPENNYFAADLTNKKPYYLIKSKKIKYYKIDLRENINHRKKYDIIIVQEVIEHVENFDIFMENLLRLINKKGILIISTINFSWLVYRIFYLIGLAPTHLGRIDKHLFLLNRTGVETNKHINHYNHNRLKKLLEYYGFRIIQNFSFCRYPYAYSRRFIRIPFFTNLLSNRLFYIAKKNEKN